MSDDVTPRGKLIFGMPARPMLIRVVILPVCVVPLAWFFMRGRPYALLFAVWIGAMLSLRGIILGYFRGRRARGQGGIS